MLRAIRNVNKFQSLRQRKLFQSKRQVHSGIANFEIPSLYLETSIWRNLDKWHDKTALVCAATNRSYTYLELYKESNLLANFSYKFRRAKSDMAVIALPNIPEFVVTLLGLVEAGFAVVPINPLYKSGEICNHLANLDVKLVFTTNEAHKTVNESLKGLKLNVPLIVVNTMVNEQLVEGAIDYKTALRQPSFTSQFKEDRNYTDTVVMPFTSGTTGRPKGVELTHKSIVSCLFQYSSAVFDDVEETYGSHQDILPVVLPVYHLFGMVVVTLHGLLKGSKLVMVPKFSSQAYINVFEQHHPTVIYLVPPIFQMLINDARFKKSHFVNVKCILCGGASLGTSEVLSLKEKVGNHVNVVQGYGSTETSSMTHCQTSRIEHGVKPGGVGLLLPLTKCKVISFKNDQEVANNQIGEFLIQGPQIMKGYYNNQEATKEALTDDGWYKTGDLGYCDNDGHFFVTGRLKEMIKVKGFQVAPAELEQLIKQLPDVEDVAVVGVPHPFLGESPRAFIVRKPNSSLVSGEVEEFVKKNVIEYKQLLGGVFFTDTIPKSPSGKILRKLLQNM